MRAESCFKFAMNCFAIYAVLILASSDFANADSMCDTPSRAICSQTRVSDDLGTVVVGADTSSLEKEIRGKTSALARQRFMSLFSQDDGRLLKKYARLTGYDGYFQTSCWESTWTSMKCRSAVSAALADRVLALNSERFEDQAVAGQAGLPFIRSQNYRLFHELQSDQQFMSIAHEAHGIEEKALDHRQTVQLATKIFSELKSMYLKKIEAWPIPQQTKSLLLERISKLKFRGPDFCAERYSSAKYFVNAFNDPKTNQVAICGGFYTRTNSPVLIASTLSHEISHSIDPCHVPKAIAAKLYGSLARCLGAQTTKSQNPSTCDENDPIGEIFADWSSADMITDYLKAVYPSAKKDAWQRRMSLLAPELCRRAEVDGDPHPSGADRMDHVLYANSKVRAMMGCPSPSSRECHLFNGPGSTSQTSPGAQKGRGNQ